MIRLDWDTMNHLARIRVHAEETAQLAAENPTPQMASALASIPEQTWRAFVTAIRYPGDYDRLMREIDQTYSDAGVFGLR